jgi:hypothetical protein
VMRVPRLTTSKEKEDGRLVSGGMNRIIHALILDSSPILAQFHFNS